MSGVAVVASTHDANFAEEVRAALQAAGLDASISQSLPKAAGSRVVLIWSAALEAGHAIDAQALIGLWSEDRLVTVRRDATPLPLGLRDLPSLPPGSTVAQICAAVPGVRFVAGNEGAAPGAGTPVGTVVAAIIAIAFAGGGAWYYFNNGRIEKQAALTMALESATKATQELREAHVRELEALKALEQARAAEDAAREAGDPEKLKEAQKAARRAEAEAAKQAEAVKQREAAAADARKKAQEGAASAKQAAAKASLPEKVAVAAVAPKAEAPKAAAKAPEPVTKAPEPVAKAVEPQKPKTRSERERTEEELLARQAALKKGVVVSAAPSQPSASAEPVASSASSASAPALPSADMFQQAMELESSDPRGAVKIYRSLARNGNAAAAKRLGEIFDKGIPGIPRDYAESLQWYETARKLGEIVIAGSRAEPAPAARPAEPGTSAAVQPAPPPAPPVVAAIPEAAKSAPPKPAAVKSAPLVGEPAKAAPVPASEPKPAVGPIAPAHETKTGWFTMRGLLIALIVLALIAWRRSRRRRKAEARQAPRASAAAVDLKDATTLAKAPVSRSPQPPAQQPPRPGDAMLFVSYSHKDRPRVDPIVSVIEDMGRRVWMDRSDITGQTGWAGQIVRAIRECRAVVLMASPNSYNSDQVVRELYLAMNHRKTIVPIEIEPAEMPDELQYILAPFQHHRLSAGETRAVLGRALAAV